VTRCLLMNFKEGKSRLDPDTVILYDIDWNPQVDLHAQDRECDGEYYDCPGSEISALDC